MNLDNLTPEEINAMSPEDFAKLDGDQLAAMAAAQSDEGEDGAGNDEDPENGNAAEQQQNADDGQDGKEEEEGNEDDGTGSDDGQGEGDEDPSKGTEGKQEPAKTNGAKPEPAAADVAVEHKAFYERMTGKISHKGVDYEIKSADEAIALMQKGLAHNDAVKATRPYTNAGRLLEEHGLLGNEEDLAFLIDLHKKDPAAIAKLVKDSGIDIYELDEEKANSYKPSQLNIVPDNVLQLRELVASNKDNEHFTAVYADANSWDNQSQETVLQDPAVLETLARHKKDGVYDKVMERVHYAVNVQGSKQPVMQLYLELGKQMYANGANAGGAAPAQQPQAKPAASNKVTRTVDPKVEAKRKTISSVRNSANKTNPNKKMTEEEIFSLSSEEFDKIDPKQLMSN